MRDNIKISAPDNKGSVLGNTNILKNEYKQQYYIHSAARISNYFSWVKFVVTISSAAIAATASTLFAVKEATPWFYIFISLSIVCFFVSVVTGLLSFVGHVKFEESKAFYSYINYRNVESSNTVQRVTVDSWYSKYGNVSFFAMVSGFALITSGIFVFWIERFVVDICLRRVAFVAFLVVIIFIIVSFVMSKSYLFKADDEDNKIDEFEKKTK